MIIYAVALVITALGFVFAARRDRMSSSPWRFADVFWFALIAWPWCVGLLTVLGDVGSALLRAR